MKKISALLGLVLLAGAATRAAGQEASAGLRESAGDLPPALNMRESDATSDADGAGALEPIAESLPAGDLDGEAYGGSILGEPMRLLQGCPSYFESTGTWLERGFWYAEMDFLLLNRGWDRKGLRLAFEGVQGSVPDGQILNAPVIGVNELRVRGERPGAEGAGRLTLGRFLFRDGSNRDHAVEASWLGGGEWSQSGNVAASTTAGLDVSDFIDRTNRSFDGARSMTFQHDHELNTVELNYTVKSRMHRDQMVLEPSGEWIRKATPSKTYSFLTGIRYLNHREQLDWEATDVTVRTTPTPALLENGTYLVNTENNMLGGQFGGSWQHETSRWSLGVIGKAGPMWNRIDLNSRFNVGETVVVNEGVVNSEEDDLSFVGEFQVLGKWHLRPNISLRAGFELLFVDSIALAPFQVNFMPGGFEQIAASGDSVYMGSSFGIESYW